MPTRIPWELIIARLKDKLTDEEEITFQKWINIGENEQLFSQLKIIWAKIQDKTSNYEPDTDFYWSELSKRINNGIANKNPNESEIGHKAKPIYMKRIYRGIAAIAVLVIISTISLLYFRNSEKVEPVIYTYSAENERKKVILPDGTEVILNSNTILTYDNSTDPHLRSASLKGEAYFDVKYNPEIPFVVKSGDVSIKVHGTEFNVNSYSSAKKIIVSLYEGSISMDIKGVNLFLEPNDEAYFDKETQVVNVEKGDIEFAKAWSQDKIRVENKNIREVCKCLSKLYQIGITIDSSVPNNQSYTFTIINGQPLEEILQTMSSITSINYSYTNSKNEILITSKK